jgi:hypothetical protein
MPSPMRRPHERSTIHVAPLPPLPCKVYVDSGTTPNGWYDAELLEWVLYPGRGWTATARYRTSPTGGYVGYFSVANIQQVNPPDLAHNNGQDV